MLAQVAPAQIERLKGLASGRFIATAKGMTKRCFHLSVCAMIFCFATPSFAKIDAFYDTKQGTNARHISIDNDYSTLKKSIRAAESHALNAPGLRFISDLNDIVGISSYGRRNNIGVSNRGLNEYLERLLKNDPKLRSNARLFYKELHGLDERLNPLLMQAETWNPKRLMDQKITFRPITLSDEAGSGKFTTLKPGWLWQLALKYAGGDSQTALRIIALCGHDDTRQSAAISLLDPEDISAQEKILRPLVGLQADLEQKIGAFMLISQPQLAAAYRPKLDSIKSLIELTGSGACPNRSSVFYLPKNLGEKTDISAALKNQIAVAQAEHRPEPSSRIPAKYYHIYASAFVECEMMARSHSPSVAKEALVGAGYGYRGSLLGRIQKTNYGESHVSQDAYFLLKYFNIGAQLGLPSTFIIPMPRSVKVINTFLRPNNGPWTQQRYDRAIEKLRSWMVDFPWTVEQNRIGADFAITVCHKH